METITVRGLRAQQSATPSDRVSRGTVDHLARRVEHLEAALAGLGAAVHRNDIAHDRQLAGRRGRHTAGPAARSPGPRGERQ